MGGRGGGRIGGPGGLIGGPPIGGGGGLRTWEGTKLGARGGGGGGGKLRF